MSRVAPARGALDALGVGSLLSARLAEPGTVVLDGGLATELERRGHDLDHPLWSARVLLSDPRAIVDVHRDYLDAGAECVTAATYQASLPGLEREGLAPAEAREVLRAAVRLAREACTEHGRGALVAASVGPYGAFLADGSEYHGRYGVSRADLRAFHAERWELLAASGADVLACETLPGLAEAEVLVDLLGRSGGVEAWFAFACRDGGHLGGGAPVERAAELLREAPGVVAVGVNCTAPRFLPELVERFAEAAPGKAVIAYPNSGEAWDAAARRWEGRSEAEDFAAAALAWRARGARLIGGCCRTGPGHVRALRAALVP